MNKCWNCLHFKTRTFARVNENMKSLFAYTKRLYQAIKKAKETKIRARYWRCFHGLKSTEYCTMEQTAKGYKACKKFSSMDE